MSSQEGPFHSKVLQLRDSWSSGDFESQIDLIDELLTEGEDSDPVAPVHEQSFLQYREGLKRGQCKGRQVERIREQLEQLNSISQKISFYTSEILSVLK